MVCQLRLWGIACIALATVSCTKPNSNFQGEGTIGNPCFPDNTCDPGLVCLAGTCENGGQSDGGGPTDGRSQDTVLPPDNGPSCVPAPAPQVDPVAGPVYHPMVALQGKPNDPGAREVIVTGGAQDVIVQIQGNRFCVEVPLNNGGGNLEVATRDQRGCTSQTATVSVNQVPYPPTNVLAGIVPQVEDVFQGGQPSPPLDVLTDGMFNQVVQASTEDDTPSCDNFAFAWVTLDAPQLIDSFVVHYSASPFLANRYATCWALLGADKGNPGSPDPNDQDWDFIAGGSDEPPGVLTVSVNRGVRHLGFLMFEDAGFGTERFAITELEAFATTPPDFRGCADLPSSGSGN